MPVMLGTEDWAVAVRGCRKRDALADWLLATGFPRGDVLRQPDEVWFIVQAASPDEALAEARRALADSPVNFDHVEVL